MKYSNCFDYEKQSIEFRVNYLHFYITDLSKNFSLSLVYFRSTEGYQSLFASSKRAHSTISKASDPYCCYE